MSFSSTSSSEEEASDDEASLQQPEHASIASTTSATHLNQRYNWSHHLTKPLLGVMALQTNHLNLLLLLSLFVL
jgi:hypothetical protein